MTTCPGPPHPAPARAAKGPEQGEEKVDACDQTRSSGPSSSEQWSPGGPGPPLSPTRPGAGRPGPQPGTRCSAHRAGGLAALLVKTQVMVKCRTCEPPFTPPSTHPSPPQGTPHTYTGTSRHACACAHTHRNV